MFIFGNFIEALAFLINIGLTLLWWIILFRALISWVNPDPFNPIVQFLRRVTDPILSPIQRFMPPMPLDISPLIACLLIMFLQRFLVASLYEMAARMHS